MNTKNFKRESNNRYYARSLDHAENFLMDYCHEKPRHIAANVLTYEGLRFNPEHELTVGISYFETATLDAIVYV